MLCTESYKLFKTTSDLFRDSLIRLHGNLQYPNQACFSPAEGNNNFMVSFPTFDFKPPKTCKTNIWKSCRISHLIGNTLFSSPRSIVVLSHTFLFVLHQHIVQEERGRFAQHQNQYIMILFWYKPPSQIEIAQLSHHKEPAIVFYFLYLQVHLLRMNYAGWLPE